MLSLSSYSNLYCCSNVVQFSDPLNGFHQADAAVIASRQVAATRVCGALRLPRQLFHAVGPPGLSLM
jgi:hypothetical protein